MKPTTLVPVEEYLSTDYSPDCDYVDGVLEERNLGERDHSRIQKRLLRILAAFESRLGIEALPEQRVQIGPSRYRVPDICVLYPGHPEEQIITKPPFICFEILSVDDRVTRVQRRVDEYLAMGVPYVWIIDPRDRRVWRCLPGQNLEVRGELRTGNPEIVISLADLFAAN
jgi:Uma2 family endonuclease